MLHLLLAAAGFLVFLGPVGAVFGRAPHGGLGRPLVYGGVALASALVAAIAAAALIGYAPLPERAVLPIGLPWLPMHFRLDGLSAFFLLVVGGVSALAAVYGLGYGRHDSEPARVLPFFPVFIAGMVLVPLADDAFAFLVAWEFMSVASWLLVMSSHREAETRRAAYVYLVMAATGTAALILAFGAMAGPAGDYAFDAIRAHPLDGAAAALAIALTLVGAGSKAGVVPLHAWLPLAHPAAPSHVSALMSGVMTKVAVYALVRVLFDLLPVAGWWWGVIVLALGGITAVLGVLYALMQNDIKTLLAYSTVENVGIIVVGIGLAVAFRSNGLDTLAGLSLIAGLLHVLNHAAFKSLLFFGAGAVLTATGERDMERLGGLIHRLPTTALMVLIGCAAISALPPLNGFVSEWLTFQAIIEGPRLAQWPLKFVVPVVGALMALAAALAAACFVKVYGIAFLGRPRTDSARRADEVDVSMRVAMIALALACVLLGVMPKLALTPLAPVVQGLVGAAPFPAGSSNSWIWLNPVADRASSYSGLIEVLLVTVLVVVLIAGVHRFATAALRRAPPWDCGYPDPRPETQYTASSFAQPIRRMFGSAVFFARETVVMPEPGDPSPAEFKVQLRDPIWEGLYAPVAVIVDTVAGRANALQFLTIRKYLSLAFAALVVLLILVVAVR